MDVILRFARQEEAEQLSALCMRSKAYWGYSEPFLAACVELLRITPGNIDETLTMVAEQGDRLAGVMQLAISGEDAELDKLFVDPDFIGYGVGSLLLKQAIRDARDEGALEMYIVSDPFAEPFYLHHGARRVGEIQSEADETRFLPRLALDLREVRDGEEKLAE